MKNIRVPLQDKIMNADHAENVGSQKLETFLTSYIDSINEYKLQADAARIKLEIEKQRMELVRRTQTLISQSMGDKDEDDLLTFGTNYFLDAGVSIQNNDSGELERITINLGTKKYTLLRKAFLKNVEEGDFLCTHIFRILTKRKLTKGL